MAPKDKKQKGEGKKIDLKRFDLKREAPEDPLDDARLYINREIAWVRFNKRILEEAQDKYHPLLERVKFLAICGSNLDEFFMVRVSGLRRQLLKGALEAPPDGLTPLEQIMDLNKEIQPMIEAYAKIWYDDLLPALAEEGVSIHEMKDLAPSVKEYLRGYFESTIYPALTPLALDLTHPFPFISGLSLNLAVSLRNKSGVQKLARIKVPTGLFHRFIQIPNEVIDEKSRDGDKSMHFVLVEDLMEANLDLLFPGMDVLGCFPFRITRDADIEIELDEAEDLLTAVEDSVEARRIGAPCRLEVEKQMPDSLRDMFATKLGLPHYLVFEKECPLGFVDFWQLVSLNRPDLKDIPFLPHVPSSLADESKMLSVIEHRDQVLYHPYDSFNIVVNLLRQAAHDPDVLAIKITLYRVDQRSPVIDALMEARQNNKAVAALVELKARFDEENNIIWARALEEAGVHVVYGLVDLKVHAKLCLIVKRAKHGIVRIAHLSSGNYNSSTARTYGDIGYLTADPEITADVQDLFNALTGYSQKEDYRKLIVAPHSMRREMLMRIEREIERHKDKKDGHIAWKLNALVDKEIIKALYRASQAGVRIDLNVRGLCCLRPGIPGVSDNIQVRSIVGRFLEHARIYYFYNGGKEEVLLGSSDMMPRNLNRRVEDLFPVMDEKIKQSIVKNMLEVHLADNVKARQLLADGTYVPVKVKDGEKKMNSQLWLIKHRGKWHGDG
ncbi:MAG: polyphosphate kinase [Methanomassiliicoccales archaeon PtaU1.Bin124]|nr:MAG: polyphosphate kinase [Methanomassiliicoccales archaeon PtaU1.Bin124]